MFNFFLASLVSWHTRTIIQHKRGFRGSVSLWTNSSGTDNVCIILSQLHPGPEFLNNIPTFWKVNQQYCVFCRWEGCGGYRREGLHERPKATHAERESSVCCFCKVVTVFPCKVWFIPFLSLDPATRLVSVAVSGTICLGILPDQKVWSCLQKLATSLSGSYQYQTSS